MLIKDFEVYPVPSKCNVFAVIIRESFQEKVTHKGRTDFQAEDWWENAKGPESPTGRVTKSRHPVEVEQGVQVRREQS